MTSLSYTVQGLSPGITYESIIVAGNEFGFSQDYHGGVIEVTTNEDGMYRIFIYVCRK